MNAQFDGSSRRTPVLTSSNDPVHRSLCESLYSATISSLSQLGPAYVAKCKEVTHSADRSNLSNLLVLQTGLVLSAQSGVATHVDDWLERFGCQYATEIERENEAREHPFSYGKTFVLDDLDIKIEISQTEPEIKIRLDYSETEHKCQNRCLTTQDDGECTIRAEQSEYGLASFCPTLVIKRIGNVWNVRSDADDDAFWLDP